MPARLGLTMGAEIITPLGMLVLRAAIASEVVQLGPFRALPHSRFVEAWAETSRARIRLLMGTIEPHAIFDHDLLPEQRVDVCWGVQWRVEAKVDFLSWEGLEFTCTWAADTTWQRGGMDPGGTVDAFTWECGDQVVNVGTISTDEALTTYAALPYFHCPGRWFDDRSLTVGGVACGLAGLSVRYPALLSGELCHAQFAVAWKTRRDADDIDTWLAVDLAPSQVTQAAHPDEPLPEHPITA